MNLMKKITLLGASLMLSLATSIAHADLKVFATVPEWGSLAEMLDDATITVISALTRLHDPPII